MIHQKQLGEDSEAVYFIVFNDWCLVTRLVAQVTNSMGEISKILSKQPRLGQLFDSGIQRTFEIGVNFLQRGFECAAISVPGGPAKARYPQLLSLCVCLSDGRRQVVRYIGKWRTRQPFSDK